MINIFKYFSLVLYIWIIYFPVSSYSQITIDSVEIIEPKSYPNDLLRDARHSDSTIWDSPTFLNTLISGQTQSNAPGGLHTFLHRGMGNRHLSVQWNGSNIQSVINGSFDLSLIPARLFNNLTFYTVGSPALNGNNALAGTLQISKKETIHPMIITISASTIQNYRISLLSRFKTGKFVHDLGIEYAYDKNVFSYRDGAESKKRTSTDFNNLNILYKSKYLFSQKAYVAMDVWFQQSDRLIPTSITSAATKQIQLDNNLRANIQYNYFAKKRSITASTTYMREGLSFMTNSINSISKVDIFLAGLEVVESKRKDYYLALRYRMDIANPNFYLGTKQRETMSLSVSKKINFSPKLLSQFSIRQDLIDTKLMPVSLTYLINYQGFTLNVARNYNLPGFNDLYWPSGGNPTLKTEKALQGELTLQHKWNILEVNLKTYANFVDNWIQWTPQNAGQWAASNQKKVLSIGAEILLSTRHKTKNGTLYNSLEYSYNKTSATDHYFDKSLIGKQLIYIPSHKFSISSAANWKKHSLSLKYTFTGERYDTPDHQSPLPVIHILDLNYTYSYNSLQWTAAINNLLNQDYGIVRYFPMPLRNASITFTYRH